MPVEKVFVYGTLRAGETNHSLLAQARLLGTCRLASGYRLYDLGAYPAAKKSDTGHALVGEVYGIDGQTLAALDRLEEYPVEYIRERVETDYGPAWIYLYCLSVARLPLIRHGDWCRRTDDRGVSSGIAASRAS